MHGIKKHIEWVVFSAGLLALAFMSPENAGTSFCMFEFAGIEFCPGEGLGHSISYTFRGELNAAVEAHFFGPFAVIILSLRIIQIWISFYKNKKSLKRDING